MIFIIVNYINSLYQQNTNYQQICHNMYNYVADIEIGKITKENKPVVTKTITQIYSTQEELDKLV